MLVLHVSCRIIAPRCSAYRGMGRQGVEGSTGNGDPPLSIESRASAETKAPPSLSTPPSRVFPPQNGLGNHPLRPQPPRQGQGWLHRHPPERRRRREQEVHRPLLQRTRASRKGSRERAVVDGSIKTQEREPAHAQVSWIALPSAPVAGHVRLVHPPARPHARVTHRPFPLSRFARSGAARAASSPLSSP
jgi:hypothetical protein